MPVSPPAAAPASPSPRPSPGRPQTPRYGRTHDGQVILLEGATAGKKKAEPLHVTRWNPITNQDRPITPVQAQMSAPKSTGKKMFQDAQHPGTRTDPIGQYPARVEAEARAAYRLHGNSLQTDGGRKDLSPDGVLNPIMGEWMVQPQGNTRSKMFEETTRGRKIPPAPPSVGVFNPLTDEWVVPPKDQRFVHGLTFAPRTMGALDSSLKM